MKQFCIFLMAFVVLVASSCNKHRDDLITHPRIDQQDSLRLPQDSVAIPQDTVDVPQDSLQVPFFNESNSRKIAWENLPAELRNAAVIKSAGDQRSNLKAATTGYYSHSIGPWGGSGGSPFSIYPPNGYRLYAIGINSGAHVDKLMIWYKNDYTNTILGAMQAGGNGGSFYMQYFTSTEYIYAVGGRSGSYVDRVTFYTNYKSFSYGGNGGSPFTASVGSAYQVLGFYGRSGAYIDRIGFYVYTK